MLVCCTVCKHGQSSAGKLLLQGSRVARVGRLAKTCAGAENGGHAACDDVHEAARRKRTSGGSEGGGGGGVRRGVHEQARQKRDKTVDGSWVGTPSSRSGGLAARKQRGWASACNSNFPAGTFTYTHARSTAHTTSAAAGNYLKVHIYVWPSMGMPSSPLSRVRFVCVPHHHHTAACAPRPASKSCSRATPSGRHWTLCSCEPCDG